MKLMKPDVAQLGQGREPLRRIDDDGQFVEGDGRADHGARQPGLDREASA